MSANQLVIIGSGLAGYLLAREWRKLNPEGPLTILTQDDGHFYSKPMLSNAWAKGKTPDTLITKTVEQMATELKATIIPHTQVTKISTDESVITAGEQTIEYDQLVLATGASPTQPNLQGNSSGVYQVNDLMAYREFYNACTQHQQVLILGAGLVGCEFANDLVMAGKTVTVAAMGTVPLDRLLPATMANKLKDALEIAGVTWQLGEVAKTIDSHSSGYQVTMKSGMQLKTELILSAIGIQPNIQLAKDAGLAVNRGLCVNNRLETSQKNIYALGDGIELNGRVEPYIAPLMLCARQLAKTLANPNEPACVHYPAMPVILKTPAYPLVICPPKKEAMGAWTITHKGNADIARFESVDGELSGYALANGDMSTRLALTQEVNDAESKNHTHQ